MEQVMSESFYSIAQLLSHFLPYLKYNKIACISIVYYHFENRWKKPSPTEFFFIVQVRND